MTKEQQRQRESPASTEGLEQTCIEDKNSVARLQALPVVTTEMMHASLMEAGVSPRQIERFLDPRNGRLRPPLDITNRYVHDLLRGVYSTIRNEPKIDEIDKWVKAQGPYAMRFREEVRRKLQSSGLAQVLPGGFDLLPDFHAALPAWAKPWYWLLRPRNYYQLGRHVASNMNWYLEPSEKVKVSTPLHLIPWWQWIYIAFVLSGPLLRDVLTTRQVTIVIFVGAALLLLLGFVKRRVIPERWQSEDIERVELYLYLTEEFSAAVDHTRV